MLPCCFMLANCSNIELRSRPPNLRIKVSEKTSQDGFLVYCLQNLNQWLALPSMLMNASLNPFLAATSCTSKNFSALEIHPCGSKPSKFGIYTLLVHALTFLPPLPNSFPIRYFFPFFLPYSPNFCCPLTSCPLSWDLLTFLLVLISLPGSRSYFPASLSSFYFVRWPIFVPSIMPPLNFSSVQR